MRQTDRTDKRRPDDSSWEPEPLHVPAPTPNRPDGEREDSRPRERRSRVVVIELA